MTNFYAAMKIPPMGHTLSTRSVRTFVLRQGRLTEGQQKSLDLYWPEFGLEVQDGPIDLDKAFGRIAPLWLEVGFGNGEALAAMAEARPDVNFLGVEVHLPGVGHVLGEIAGRSLGNVRIVRYDALELLDKHIPEDRVERLSLFFPDPWHKKRHHKRRIVNPEFLALVNRAMVSRGLLHIATDWQAYAQQIQETLINSEHFKPVADTELYEKVTGLRPRTKFEQRGLKLGHSVSDLLYQRCA